MIILGASHRQFRVKRIHDAASGDGHRVLVDRLWPQGITNEWAALDLWCKEIAPSTELRRRYLATHASLTLLTATNDLSISAAEVLAMTLQRPDGIADQTVGCGRSGPPRLVAVLDSDPPERGIRCDTKPYPMRYGRVTSMVSRDQTSDSQRRTPGRLDHAARVPGQ